MRTGRAAIRFAAAALTLLGVVPLASCSSTATAGHGPLKDLLYINPLLGDPAWDRFGSCMTDEGTHLGIKVRTTGPPGDKVDPVTMQNQLAQAVANKAQAIVTWSGGASAAFDALFAKAKAQGTLTATYLSWDQTKNQDIQIGDGPPAEADEKVIASIAAHPGHQYVGIITQRPGYYSFGDLESTKKIAAKFPNVTIVDLRFDYGTFADDLDITTQMLAAHPEINAIANYNTFTGVLTAIKEKELVGKVFAYTGYEPGHPQPIVDAINAGLIGDVRVADWCAAGRTAIDKLDDLSKGKKVDSSYENGFHMATPEEFKQLAAAGKL